MEIKVLGGGVIGVTTAYYLALEGHDVEVIERYPSLALDATSGNAGLIAPGHSFSWASPAAPKMLLQSLRGKKTAIRVKPRVDPALARWGLKFLGECSAEAAERNTVTKVRLCQYSQRLMYELAAKESIDYRKGAEGCMYLYRDKTALEVGYRKAALLKKHGQDQRVLSASEVVEREPGLASAEHLLAGAVFDATDSSGDSELFTHELADRCRALGVRFRMGTAVHRLESSGDRITGAVIDGGMLRGDQYVLAMGVDSPALAKTVGYRLPIYPAKGYSVTFPIRGEHTPPTHAGVDEATLVAWASFGDRFRMSSTAEFVGYSRAWKADDFSNILSMAKDLFPNAADFSAGQFRACLRPMTPGGPPAIGYAKHKNLLFNTGHGHMGWTMACGSGVISTDLIAGRTPDFDISGMKVVA